MTILREAHFDTGETPVMRDYDPNKKVTVYRESSGFKYPHMMMECESMTKTMMLVIRGLLGTTSVIEEHNVGKYYWYVTIGDSEPVMVGMIPANRLRVVLSDPAFAKYDKKLSLSEDETYSGDMCYALCPAI